MRSVVGLVLAVALVACASPTDPRQGDPAVDRGAPRAGGTKEVTAAIVGDVPGMGVAGDTTTSGGWYSYTEVYADGLVTSDLASRAIVPRLASRLPTLDDSSIELLPDGRMKVVWQLRPDATWHDGTPLTSADLLFTYQMGTHPYIPSLSRETFAAMESVEAPDDQTFVVYYRAPYYRATALGARGYLIAPKHILVEPFARAQGPEDVQAFLAHPYFSSGFIHLGPFRLTQFAIGEEMVFEAYDGYFLGRPKVDRIVIRIFNDENTLFANLLSGDVTLMASALAPELALQLQQRWQASGEGTVAFDTGVTRFVRSQWKPDVQWEPAVLDPPVRRALYHAVDREGLLDVVAPGRRELIANSLVPRGSVHYEAVRDGFAQFTYDPSRARAILREAGWSPGPDGMLRHLSDNRAFRTSVWGTPGTDQVIAIIADGWRGIGLQAEEHAVPGALVRDREYRASFPGWEFSANGSGDAILAALLLPDPRRPSRDAYANPTADGLVQQYYQSIREADQARALGAISEFTVAELPLLLLYYQPEPIVARGGVKALDDWEGGAEAAQNYGTYSRNAYLWDLQ